MDACALPKRIKARENGEQNYAREKREREKRKRCHRIDRPSGIYCPNLRLQAPTLQLKNLAKRLRMVPRKIELYFDN